MTIRDLWAQALLQHAQRPFLSFVGSESWSFSEVGKRVAALQNLFQTYGIKEGAKIAIYAPNQPGWGCAYIAITTASLTAIPLLTDFHPREVAFSLSHSGSSLLLIGRSLKEAWDRWLEQENPVLPAGLQTFILEDLMDELDLESVGSYSPPTDDTLAAILYTSGTTGASKGVMLTHKNITSNVLAGAPIPGIVAGDCCLSVLPLAHTYECTLGLLVPMHLGACVYYLGKPAAPAVLLPALALIRPHFMLTVPIFIEKIYRQKILPSLDKGLLRILRKIPPFGFLFTRIAGKKLMKTFGGRMKFFGVGGAPLAPEVEAFLHKAGFPYAIGYGLTETAPLLAGSLEGRVFSTGPVLGGVTIKISDHRNSEGAGEILVKGPNVTPGYFKDPLKTSEAFTSDGWFKTGDLGCYGKKGHLFIKGRLKNLILGPNGENIYPEAIEALLNQNNMVLESLVIQRGTDLIAKVVLNYEAVQSAVIHWAARHGKDIAAWSADFSAFVAEYLAELRSEINHQLNRFCRLNFVEEQKEPFEKTATLKIKRYLYA